MSEIYYLLRSQADGKYLVAKITEQSSEQSFEYLLIFTTDFAALSYMNTHAPDLKNLVTVESIVPTQLKSLLLRWGYHGIGLVEDPLLPQIKFSNYQP